MFFMRSSICHLFISITFFRVVVPVVSDVEKSVLTFLVCLQAVPVAQRHDEAGGGVY